MYAYIFGEITLLEPTFVVVEACGVGYHLRISLATYSKLKQVHLPVRVYTYLHITEGSHTLYGFAEPDEKQMFLHLIGVSGVGPGTAMAALSSLSVAELHHAILKEDVRSIQSIKGLGAKTAQRLIIELKDKLQRAPVSAQQVAVSHTIEQVIEEENIKENALNALLTLGIPKATAEKSIDTVLRNEGAALTLEELIKKALKSK